MIVLETSRDISEAILTSLAPCEGIVKFRRTFLVIIFDECLMELYFLITYELCNITVIYFLAVSHFISPEI